MLQGARKLVDVFRAQLERGTRRKTSERALFDASRPGLLSARFSA